VGISFVNPARNTSKITPVAHQVVDPPRPTYTTSRDTDTTLEPDVSTTSSIFVVSSQQLATTGFPIVK